MKRKQPATLVIESVIALSIAIAITLIFTQTLLMTHHKLKQSQQIVNQLQATKQLVENPQINTIKVANRNYTIKQTTTTLEMINQSNHERTVLQYAYN